MVARRALIRCRRHWIILNVNVGQCDSGGVCVCVLLKSIYRLTVEKAAASNVDDMIYDIWEKLHADISIKHIYTKWRRFQ